ncbi:MAG: hypothetical protein A2007_05225 [Verrucomicrobia bacterium GWC2_42_7]|nr:MAG: hypothetical protein A2007_05225 [Verrucomicrobia bacterium GWC2_42_7]
MALIVQKFGGTSVADLDCVRRVAKRIKGDWLSGNKVVVVVSARAGLTDELIRKAKSLNESPSPRELDALISIGEQESMTLLSIALQTEGVPAISRTGAQAGILTDFAFNNANILSVSGSDIQERLNEGKVVIVAGFQGTNALGETTTLGRGGSDLTAIALAHALRADHCKIFTDVEGVFSTDPKIVSNAKKLDEISFDHMFLLASMGSKVMQSRAVSFAKDKKIPFEILSTFSDKPGTFVKEIVEEKTPAPSIALDRDQKLVTVQFTSLNTPTSPPLSRFLDLFQPHTSLDMLESSTDQLSFSIPSHHYAWSKHATDAFLAETTNAILLVKDIAKISLVGIPSSSIPIHQISNTLKQSNINLYACVPSPSKISLAVDIANAESTVSLLHQTLIHSNDPIPFPLNLTGTYN